MDETNTNASYTTGGGDNKVTSVTADTSAWENYQKPPTDDSSANKPSQKNSGPLGPLYENNKFAAKALSYPRDLSKLGKGHSVQFNIRNIKPSEAVAAAAKAVVSSIESGVNAAQTAANSTKEENQKKITEAGQKLYASGQTVIKEVVNGEAVKKIMDMGRSTVAALTKESYDGTLTTIRLYMPDSLSFNYNAQYDKLSLADALASVPVVGRIPAIGMSILNNNAMKYAGGKLGYTFNPQQQMLFEGIDFREFEMQFVFTPTSEKEAETVRQIIRELRIAAAPTRNLATAGFFFTPPSVFNISFFFEQQFNYFITPIRPCVLQNISVDFAPSGWSAMRDGSPMQTSVSLSFREIELVDRESIKTEWDGR